MIVNKQSSFHALPEKKSPETDYLNNYGQTVDTDFTHISQAINGNLRFGNVSNLVNGENISGQFVVVTTTTANTEVVVPHTLNVIPTGFLVTGINVGGVVYSSGTAWTSTNVYLKCSAANATINIFLLN